MSEGQFLDAVRTFAKEGWPAIEKDREEYREREAKASARREGAR